MQNDSCIYSEYINVQKRVHVFINIAQNIYRTFTILKNVNVASPNVYMSMSDMHKENKIEFFQKKNCKEIGCFVNTVVHEQISMRETCTFYKVSTMNHVL